MPPYKPWTISPLNPYGDYKAEEFSAETAAREQAARQRKYDADVLAEQAAQALRAKQFALLEDQTAYARSRDKPLGTLQTDWDLHHKNLKSSISSRESELADADFRRALQTGVTSPRFTESQNTAILGEAYKRRLATQQDKAALNMATAQLQGMSDAKARSQEKPPHHLDNLASALLKQLSPMIAPGVPADDTPFHVVDPHEIVKTTGGFGPGSPFMEAAYAAPRVGKTREQIADYEDEVESRRKAGLGSLEFTSARQEVEGRGMVLKGQKGKRDREEAVEKILGDKTKKTPAERDAAEILAAAKEKADDRAHKERLQQAEKKEMAGAEEDKNLITSEFGSEVHNKVAQHIITSSVVPEVSTGLGEVLPKIFSKSGGVSGSGNSWKVEVGDKMSLIFKDIYNSLSTRALNAVGRQPNSHTLSDSDFALQVNRLFHIYSMKLVDVISKEEDLEGGNSFLPEHVFAALAAEAATHIPSEKPLKRIEQLRSHIMGELASYSRSMASAASGWLRDSVGGSKAIVGKTPEGLGDSLQRAFLKKIGVIIEKPRKPPASLDDYDDWKKSRGEADPPGFVPGIYGAFKHLYDRMGF